MTAAALVMALAGSSALAAGEEIVVQSGALDSAFSNNWIDHSVGNTNSSVLVTYPTCLKLVNYDEDLDTAVPEAATGMPTVSGDGLTYTFTVGSGHAFSDGEAVTATSFERAIDRALALSTSAQGLLANVTGVNAAGSTLTVTLSARTPDLPHRLATSYFCATPSSAPPGFSSAPLPAAGPYYISSASTSEIVLVRNPNYGGTRTQNLGTIRWRPEGSPGSVDYVANPITTPGGLELIASPTTGVEMLFLNTTIAPFDTTSTRQAVAFAIDRAALATAYTVPLTPTDTFLSPLMAGAVDHDVYPLDGSGAPQAVTLLAGQTPAVNLCYPINPARTALSAAIETQLEAVGFVVTRTGYSFGDFFNLIVPNPNSGCDMNLFTLFPSYPDPAAFLPVMFHGDSPPGTSNRSFFDDPAFNARFDAATQLTDDAARLAEYADLDNDLAVAAPNVAIGFQSRRDFISDRIGCTALSRARFGGFALNRLCIEVSETAAPGDTVTTGGDATPEAPLQTSVTVPAGGTGGDVTITQGISDASELPVYKLLEQELDISAPAQSPANPLELRFEIDAQALVDAGLTIGAVVVYRNGSPVSDCDDPGATAAAPDPCVESRTSDGQGDGVIVVRTSQASTWNFGGFAVAGPFSPVDSQPTVNTMNAGRTVPVKFSLGGDFGLDVFETGYPVSQWVACAGGVPQDDVESTSSTGSGLSYDAATGTYQYNWKTQKAWAGQCRTLILKFDDGQELKASFKFT